MTSVSLIQPVIIFAIVFIGNTINVLILPITLVATAIGIISNLSDKIQIGKLANFLKSSIIWVLGVVITIFVSVLSLEGGLTSSIDGLTAKGIKSAATTFIPVVGKALGESTDMVLRLNSSFKKLNRNSWNVRNNWNMCYANSKTCNINIYISFRFCCM